jgi:RNA 3'-terminal phosphate cyclase
MLDQILPYMALAGAGSIVLAEELSNHARTNIWVIERFLGRKFDVTQKDGLTEIRTV